MKGMLFFIYTDIMTHFTDINIHVYIYIQYTCMYIYIHYIHEICTIYMIYILFRGASYLILYLRMYGKKPRHLVLTQNSRWRICRLSVSMWGGTLIVKIYSGVSNYSLFFKYVEKCCLKSLAWAEENNGPCLRLHSSFSYIMKRKFLYVKQIARYNQVF